MVNVVTHPVPLTEFKRQGYFEHFDHFFFKIHIVLFLLANNSFFLPIPHSQKHIFFNY